MIEKEMRDVITQGDDALDLLFHENSVLKKGLNGIRRVSIRLDAIEGVSSISCTFTASLKYTAVHAFGLTTCHFVDVETKLTVIL